MDTRTGGQKGFTMKRNIRIFLTLVLLVSLSSCLTLQNTGTNTKNQSLNNLIMYDKSIDEIINAINNGANVNEINMFGVTPLMFAVSKSNVEIVELLIEHGADVSAEAEGSYTPLFYAVEINSDETIPIVDLLLDAGANIEHRNYKGQTVLLYAAEMNSNQELLQHLIEKGANPNSNDNEGNNLEYYIANCKNGIIQ